LKELDIINGCKVNDRRSQRAFVDQYSAYLMGVCRRYVSQPDQAQDCLQEGLVQILKKIDKYQATGSFKAWAARVTATQCLQYIRREKRHINFELESAPEPQQEETITNQLEVQDVMNFLESIPDQYRIAINMFIIEGYSHREISEQLGITEGSSRSLVARGRKMIITNFKEKTVNGNSTLTMVKNIKRLA